jgi:hypothetical protein
MKVGVAAIFVGSTESFCFGGRWSNWSNCEIEDGSQCGVGVRKRSKVCGFGSNSEEETDPCEKATHFSFYFLIKIYSRACMHGVNGATVALNQLARKISACEIADPTAAWK